MCCAMLCSGSDSQVYDNEGRYVPQVRVRLMSGMLQAVTALSHHLLQFEH